MNSYSMTKEEMRELIDAALGRVKADLILLDGDLVNVYTKEVMSGYSVAVKGKRIAYVGKDARHTIGHKTQIIEAMGKVIIPGFVDAHTHIIALFDINEFVKHALRAGTTTVVTEAMEPAMVVGYPGLQHYLKIFRHQPMKILATLPPMVSISPETNKVAMTDGHLRRLLKKDIVVGLGESYWLPTVEQDERVLSLLSEALASGKQAEGHSAGARNDKLVAYFATGISSCHESITADEVLERLRLGIYTMVREGAVRSDLQAIAALKSEPVDLRRLILVSDGITPKTLLNQGYMNLIVQRVINLGFNPITAIRMATINPTEHFSLDGYIGGIAPGKLADIVIIPDLRTISPELVISNGKVVAQDGKSLVTPEKPVFPRSFRQTIRLSREFAPGDFTVSASGKREPVTVRVINIATELVSREEMVIMLPAEGLLEVDISNDLLKVAVVDRFSGKGKMFTGFIRGFKMKRGAIATSAIWDMSGIVVVGTNDRDMAKAVNRIFELQGGVVVCADGAILAELPLPLLGIVSDLPLEAIAERLAQIQQKAAELGIPFTDAHLSLIILTSPAIPFLRICESGLVDIRENRFVSLIV